MNFFYFLLMFFGGLGMVIYREAVQRFIGNIPVAEQYLGSGGTYTFLLLIGLFFMVGSLMWITGSLDFLVEGTIGKIFVKPE
jgi:hypothetical protein